MHVPGARTATLRVRAVALMCAALLCRTSLASADEFESRAGHGHVSLLYQYISVDGFESSIGEIPIGLVDTHTLFLEVDYYLTEKITLVAGIPYVRKRYKGTFPHDPLALNPPRTWVENIDQGQWNSDFQDFHLGVRYLAKDGPVSIEPYAYLGLPSSEYPFFGNAAVGQHQTRLDIGSSFTWLPGLSNAYYRADIAYVFVEEILGVSVNHWKVNGEMGYQFGPRATGRVFFLLKDGQGLSFPEDFPPPRDNELWYQHDRLVRHNYMNVGVGFDWALDDKYYVFTNVMTQTWADQVHKMRYAITVGISRAF